MSQIQVRITWADYEAVEEFDNDWIRNLGFDPDYLVEITDQDIETREYILIGEELAG